VCRSTVNVGERIHFNPREPRGRRVSCLACDGVGGARSLVPHSPSRATILPLRSVVPAIRGDTTGPARKNTAVAWCFTGIAACVLLAICMASRPVNASGGRFRQNVAGIDETASMCSRQILSPVPDTISPAPVPRVIAPSVPPAAERRQMSLCRESSVLRHATNRVPDAISAPAAVRSSAGGLTATCVPARVAENGSYYGQPNVNGVPKTVYVHEYVRGDGTYVQSHYRSPPNSNPPSSRRR
jgi:hypothetical protein